MCKISMVRRLIVECTCQVQGIVTFLCNVQGINGNMMGGDMQGLHIVFLFFASIMFAVSVVALFGYHCVLVVNNWSTLGKYTTLLSVCISC